MGKACRICGAVQGDDVVACPTDGGRDFSPVKQALKFPEPSPKKSSSWTPLAEGERFERKPEQEPKLGAVRVETRTITRKPKGSDE